MQIISFIDEVQEIRRMLEILDLWSDTPCGEALPDAPDQGEPVDQPFDDGRGGYDAPSVTLNRDFQTAQTPKAGRGFSRRHRTRA
jgi:hypothetical protein